MSDIQVQPTDNSQRVSNIHSLNPGVKNPNELMGQGNYHNYMYYNGDVRQIPAIMKIEAVVSGILGFLDWQIIQTDPATGLETINTTHYLNQVFKEPNDYDDVYTFKAQIASDLILFGNAFIKPFINTQGRVDRLETIEQSRITAAWTVDAQDHKHKVFKDWTAGRVFTNKNLIHIKARPSAGDDPLGINPSHYAQPIIQDILNQMKFDRDFYSKGGDDLVVYKNERIANQEEIENLKIGHQNIKKGIPAIVSGGWELEQHTGSGRSKLFLDERYSSIEEIARIYNVTSAILGVHNDIKFNNLSNLIKQFKTETLQPLGETISEALTRHLVVQRNMRIEIDFKALEQINWVDLSNVITKLAGVVSINEIRSLFGFSTVKDGDKVITPLNMAIGDSVEDTADTVEDDKSNTTLSSQSDNENNDNTESRE